MRRGRRSGSGRGDAVDLRHARADRFLGLRRGWFASRECRVHHRLDDFLVAGAAAQHAAERIAHLRFARVFSAREQVARRHQHAGGADAALRGAVTMKGALQLRHRLAAREPFDRDDRAALDLGERREAGTDLAAIDEHRAGAAVARVATDLGTGEAKLVAQHVREARDRRRGRAHRTPVQLEGDGSRRELGARAVHAADPRLVRQRMTKVCAASLR
jgi:hypothetical protein